ncbi:MAG: SpoIIE family protein phosphatase, partial [Anaerolineae bacterium]|nr:SpoIIE family protein phosphatase [Anaerolineae bacterium]
RLLGVLDIQSNQLGGLHEVDQLVLHTLADSIAIGIHSANLLAELQWKVDQLEAILEVSHKLTSILDFDHLIDEVVDSLHKRFGYPFIHLFTVHSGRRKIFYHAGSGARSRSLAAQELAYDLDDPNGIIPLVARSGKSYLTNDVTKDAVYRPSQLLPSETGSELTIPVMIGEEVLGVLDIQSDEMDAFDASDTSLFEALAGTIAISLRNANLYRAEQWRREVAVGFRDVAELVSTGQNLETLLNAILDKLEALLPCEVSAIWLYPDAASNAGQENNALLLATSHGVESYEIQQRLSDSPQMQAWFNQVINLPDPTVRSPQDLIGPLGAALGYESDYSSIAAPLRAGDVSLGLLTLAHPTPGRYGTEARSITATFASYAAMAIRDAQLFANAQEQAWISTILLQVSNACQNSESIDDLLETITRLLPLLIGINRSAIYLWENHHNAFRLKTSYGLEAPAQTALFSPEAYPPLQRLFGSQAPLIIRGNSEEISLPGMAALAQDETLALLPLISRGQLLGAYLISYTAAEPAGLAHIIDDEILTFLQGIAQQVSTALENLMLFEARQQEGYVTAALLQVAQAVVTQSSLTEILDTIIHLLPILLGIDTGIIYLWNESVQAFEPAEVYCQVKAHTDYWQSRKFRPQEFDLLFDTFLEEQISFIPLSSADVDVTQWSGLSCVHVDDENRLVEFAGQALVLAIPLSVKEERFGVFVVKENPTTPGIREKRLEMLTGIAQQISLAIQNDRYQQQVVEQQALEREMAFAREIQQNFLPDELPHPPGWQVDAKWQTARTVGGDFYDIFHITPDRLGLVIADVSDKGLPASLYMTVTRTLIRSFLTPEASPAEVLTRVNQALLSSSRSAMFVTAVVAVLDLSTGKLVYTNAGHNRPILRNGEKRTARLLPKGGIALGANEDAMLTEKSFKIQAGDCLLFYTDGITEALSSSDEAFGEQRLVRLVNRASGDGVKMLLERLDAALAEFRGGAPISDDITLLAIGRLPAAEA